MPNGSSNGSNSTSNAMNRKPRWHDREGNLYTDAEVKTFKNSPKVFVREGYPVKEIEVLPLGKKFPK